MFVVQLPTNGFISSCRSFDVVVLYKCDLQRTSAYNESDKRHALCLTALTFTSYVDVARTANNVLL